MTTTISKNAMTILKERYLVKGESVEGMFRRVAGGNDDFYNLMAELRFLPNSPTLFNMGLNNGCTSSACFVFDVDDTMFDGPRSIVATRAKAAAVAKAGGGVGYYFGNLRPKGSPIKTVQRVACGPVTVLYDYHGVQKLITQGGKRDLAQMGVLPADHPDIEDFINCKNADPQSLSSFNISVSWKDDLIRESMQPGTRAAKLWDMQVASAWKTGCPGMLFHDAVNRANFNSHLGLINATNPCGETPNRSDEPCNLGSLNLTKYFVKAAQAIDFDRLTADAYTATLFLDDILDRNRFPHPDITKAALLTRKLGLGVMGWADLLALLHIHYDTQDAVDLADEVMAAIAQSAQRASLDLAASKGPYAGYSDLSRTPMIRNETRTSIAPTGTISIIADCSSSIEPHYALEWTRTTKEGFKLQERIAVWDQLDGFMPKIAGEIAPKWHVAHQAAFQKHTCLGVSKTVNLPNKATREDVSSIYRLMYDSGCKGGTIYRDGCRSEQVLVAKESKSVFTTGMKQPLPDERKSLTHKFKVSGTECFLTVGLFDDGKPGEVFLRVSKMGSTADGMFDSWAITFSVALQRGVPLADLIRHHKGTRFEPSGTTSNPKLPVCSSIPDYIARWLEAKFIAPQKEDSPSTDSGVYCPDCGAEAIYQAGCLTCPTRGCGWTRCG